MIIMQRRSINRIRNILAYTVAVPAAVILIGWVSYEAWDALPAQRIGRDFPGYAVSHLTIRSQEIYVADAYSQDQQDLGLGKRDSLGLGEGMLFVFPEDKEYAFWMKDMRFSIDMVWISSAGKIIYMAQDVSPDTYPEDFVPTSPARYVLELPAGYSSSHGFSVGDTVQF